MHFIKKNNQRHPFHLVDPSPWPFMGAMGALALTFGCVMYMHSYSYGLGLFSFGFLTILFTMYVWWQDIIREGTFEGQHTWAVQLGLRQGVLLFIISEIMFFFAFFWAFFDASIKPAIVLGGVWPPNGLETLSPWGIPLLNTIVLLTSGVSITWAHHAIVSGAKKSAQTSLFLTILLAIIFTGLQVFEYLNAPFSISDCIDRLIFLVFFFSGFYLLLSDYFLPNFSSILKARQKMLKLVLGGVLEILKSFFSCVLFFLDYLKINLFCFSVWINNNVLADVALYYRALNIIFLLSGLDLFLQGEAFAWWEDTSTNSSIQNSDSFCPCFDRFLSWWKPNAAVFPETSVSPLSPATITGRLTPPSTPRSFDLN
jgi:heme/copper-type cytochrome/quinol oxidase subunit 3